MESHNSTVNLNPKYIMTLYDIDLMKKTVQDIDITLLLKKCPIQTLSKNTLLYHPTKLTESELNDYRNKLGTSPSYEEETTLYYFNFLNHYQEMISQKQFDCEVLYNKENLKLLDLTRISVELGFNPLMNKVYTVGLKKLYNYCKKNKLDGFVTFNITGINEDYESNYNYQDNGVKPISPVVYLTNLEDYGNYKLNILSVINLNKGNRKNKEFLSKREAIKLNNFLFCNIIQIIKYGHKTDVKLNVKMINNSYQLLLKSNEKHDLNYIFDIKNKYLLDMLLINNTNLLEECDFYLPPNKEMDELTSNSDINNIEITYNIELDDNFNNDIFDILLNEIAITNDIKPFVYINYDKLSTEIDYLEKYDYDLINMHYDTLIDIKRLIKNIEKTIISKMNFYYKKSPKGFKANVNFIQLEYIPDTYEYIKNIIIDELEKLPIDEAISLISGNKFNKSIVKYFNVDNLYHSITNAKYDSSKKLYQSLLNNITTYEQKPNINLKLIDLLTELSDNESKDDVSNFIKNVKLHIYDYYKKYIASEILFPQLYEFLGVDVLYNFMTYFAQINNINSSIIVNYDKIVSQKGMDKYKLDYLIKELKNTDLTDIEFLNQWIQKLKIHIIITKLYYYMLNHYHLDDSNEEVVTFLKSQLENIIMMDLESSDSLVNNLITSENTDWDILKFNFINFIRLFENNNSNEKVLEIIYQLLDKKLNEKNKRKILQLLNNKKLLQLYMKFLNNEITENELSKIVFTSLTENKLNHEDYNKSKKDMSENEDSEISTKSKKSKKSRKKSDSDEETI
jgi:hypothetical protein